MLYGVRIESGAYDKLRTGRFGSIGLFSVQNGACADYHVRICLSNCLDGVCCGSCAESDFGCRKSAVDQSFGKRYGICGVLNFDNRDDTCLINAVIDVFHVFLLLVFYKNQIFVKSNALGMGGNSGLQAKILKENLRHRPDSSTRARRFL